MHPRIGTISAAGGALLVFVLLVLRAQPPAGSAGPIRVDPSITPPAAEQTSGPVAMPGPAISPAPRRLVTHAVEVSRLNGFPPDASAGDVFDIWVAWNPPIVKGPNIRLLLKDVGLEKVAPPVTPDGPHVAFLVMTRAEARDLLYGTRYGALSVTQPAG